jgi:stage II sporulation protein B
MDKQGKKEASITIKINGDKKKYKEEELLVHNWKLGEEESAAAEESAEEDSFDWVLPDEDPVPKEFKKINYVQKKTGKRKFGSRQLTPGISRMIYTLVGAIAVSLILGFIILNVITEGEQAAPAIQLQEEEASGTGTGTEAVKGAVTIESFNASVVQGGYFTNEDSAKSEQASLQDKGIPTVVLSLDSNHYLFLGTAGDLEGAKSMGEKLAAENIEVYAKDIVLPEKQFEGTEADSAFAKKSKSVFAALAAESSNAYTSGKVNNEKMTEISTLIKELSGMKADSDGVKSLKEKLESAALNLQEYQSSSQLQKLMAAQQSLLSYLEAYHKL